MLPNTLLVAEPQDAALLDTVRSYLTSSDSHEYLVPEMREAGRVFGLAHHDLGVEYETTALELVVTERGDREATVSGTSTFLTRHRGQEAAYEQEVTVHLVEEVGWNVRELVVDGQPTYSRLHPVIVEPAEADGIRIQAWARDETSGDVLVAISVHNGTSRPWRLKCAGAAWRLGLCGASTRSQHGSFVEEERLRTTPARNTASWSTWRHESSCCGSRRRPVLVGARCSSRFPGIMHALGRERRKRRARSGESRGVRRPRSRSPRSLCSSA